MLVYLEKVYRQMQMYYHVSMLLLYMLHVTHFFKKVHKDTSSNCINKANTDVLSSLG